MVFFLFFFVPLLDFSRWELAQQPLTGSQQNNLWLQIWVSPFEKEKDPMITNPEVKQFVPCGIHDLDSVNACCLRAALLKRTHSL